MRRATRLSMLWLCAALAAVPGRADHVDLVNGDRLTGKVLRKDADHLILRTPYAGEIRIAWSQIARVRTDEPMSLVLSDQSLARTRAIGSAPGAVEPPDSEAPPSSGGAPGPAVAPDEVAYINAGPGIDLLGVRWKGRVNLGGGGHRGNSDTDNLHVDGEAIARLRRERYTVGGVLDRGKDRDVVTRQSSRVSSKYDLFIDKTRYGYALATVEADRFRDVDRRTTLGAGLGRQLVENERTQLSVEVGLNHVRTDFSLAPDERYPALRWALKFERRLAGTDLRLFHSHELLSDIQRTENAFLRSQTGVRIPLLQQLLATAQLNVDYDNTPAPGKVRSDRTYLFTLGYQWQPSRAAGAPTPVPDGRARC